MRKEDTDSELEKRGGKSERERGTGLEGGKKEELRVCHY